MKVNNSDAFKKFFNGLYATELWSMPEHEFTKWLNDEYRDRTFETTPNMEQYLVDHGIKYLGPKRTRSKIKRCDMIEFLYHLVKKNEILDKYHAKEWLTLIEDVDLDQNNLIDDDTLFGYYFKNNWSHLFK